ncbi:MAG: response regulator [Nitrospirae bacterium]|nr:MAG: response regulator [Nitrospirota bacterium]
MFQGVLSRRCEITVLVLDDEPTIVAALLQYLDKRGYKVVGLTDPELAEKLLATDLFDFAIIDIRLKDKNGLEVLRRAKDRGYRGEYILISAFAEDFVSAMTEEDRKRLIEKPFKMYSIVDKMEELKGGKS